MILTLLIDLDGLFSLVDFLVASCSITEHIRVDRYCSTTAILSTDTPSTSLYSCSSHQQVPFLVRCAYLSHFCRHSSYFVHQARVDVVSSPIRISLTLATAARTVDDDIRVRIITTPQSERVALSNYSTFRVIPTPRNNARILVWCHSTKPDVWQLLLLRR